MKKCPCCGKIYLQVPDFARIASNGDAFDGAYWECENCKSTMFLPAKAWVIAVNLNDLFELNE